MRIFLYLVIVLFCILLGALPGLFFIGDSNLLLKVGQGIESTMTFIVPPIVYYYIMYKEKPMQMIGFRKISPFWLVFVGIALMFLSLPVTNLLTEWNESMSLGYVFPKLETLLRNLEKTAEQVTERLLNMNNIRDLLLNLIIIALIPAIGEELTFRGVLQQSLTRQWKNTHLAILLSAALFSFFHFQFYGFLPRMFLGLLLGYMFYVSGSLWTSIAMHFVNNGSVVVLYYFNSKGIVNVDVDHFGKTQNVWIILASVILTMALIIWSWKKAAPEKKASRS